MPRFRALRGFSPSRSKRPAWDRPVGEADPAPLSRTAGPSGRNSAERSPFGKLWRRELAARPSPCPGPPARPQPQQCALRCALSAPPAGVWAACTGPPRSRSLPGVSRDEADTPKSGYFPLLLRFFSFILFFPPQIHIYIFLTQTSEILFRSKRGEDPFCSLPGCSQSCPGQEPPRRGDAGPRCCPSGLPDLPPGQAGRPRGTSLTPATGRRFHSFARTHSREGLKTQTRSLKFPDPESQAQGVGVASPACSRGKRLMNPW